VISESDIERLRTALFAELAGLLEDDALLLITGCVVRWRRSGNAYHMLHALVQCRNRSIIPASVTLAAEMADAAQALLESRSRGTPGAVRRGAVKDSALFVMVSLRYAGLTISEAAAKAAAWSANKRYPLKASTLEKYYEGVGSAPEAHYFPQWDDLRPNLRAEMREFAKRMPDPPARLRGERR